MKQNLAFAIIGAALILVISGSSNAYAQYGTGSSSTDEGISLKLSRQSNGGSYIAEIRWIPGEPGINNSFYVSIYDSNHKWLPSASYDFAINGDAQATKVSENGSETTRLFKYLFQRQGSYSIILGNINGSGESIQIPIQVTPEFPTSIVIIATAGVIGFVILIGRIKFFVRH